MLNDINREYKQDKFCFKANYQNEENGLPAIDNFSLTRLSTFSFIVNFSKNLINIFFKKHKLS